MKLRAPGPKSITLKPVRPNVGVRVAYQRELMALVDGMHADMMKAIEKAYKDLPEIAQDASTVNQLQKAMDQAAKEWRKNFEQEHKRIAKAFADGSLKSTDVAFKSGLRKAGFSVKMQMNQGVQSALDSVIGENVGLIRSIAEKHLGDVQGMVMRSVQKGRSLKELTKDLQERYNVTRNRAVLIARDQNNKATAMIHRARQKQFGLTKAVWSHTSASVHPREEHEEWNGETYDIEEGMWSEVDQEFVFPGTAINCLPGDSTIELANGCKQLWRRWYTGELTMLVTASGKLLKATPNHPVLTSRGWLPIQSVNMGDDVVSIPTQIFDGIEANVQGAVSTFQELFETISQFVTPHSAPGISKLQFHGDVSDGEVETIAIDGFLASKLDATFCQKFCELVFTGAEECGIAGQFAADARLYSAMLRLFAAPESIIRCFATLLPILKSGSRRTNEVCLRAITNMNTGFNKAWSNASPSDAILFRKLKLADTGFIIGDDLIVRELFGVLSRARWDDDTTGTDKPGDSAYANANALGDLTKCNAFVHEYDRVVNKSGRSFTGHVYNLHNDKNWYTSQGLLYHNMCGCTSRSVIPGYDEDEVEEAS